MFVWCFASTQLAFQAGTIHDVAYFSGFHGSQIMVLGYASGLLQISRVKGTMGLLGVNLLTTAII